MKDFAKSIRTNNADLGLRPVVPQMVKDVAKLYEDNGKDREKTKQDLVRKLHIDETKAEEILRQIVGNSKVGNSAYDDMKQAKNIADSIEGKVKREGLTPEVKSWANIEIGKINQIADYLEKSAKSVRDEANKMKQIVK